MRDEILSTFVSNTTRASCVASNKRGGAFKRDAELNSRTSSRIDTNYAGDNTVIGESVGGTFVRIRANLGVTTGMLVVLVALILALPGGAFRLDGNAARLSKVVLIVLAAFLWMNVAFAFGSATVGRLLGARVRKISIGGGPDALSMEIGQLRIALGPFLSSGFVQFFEDGKGLRQLPAISQAIVALSGPIAAVAASALVLREQAIGVAARTWPQVYAIVTDFSRSWDAIPSILTTEHDRGLIFAVTLIATKAAAFNLLPIPLFGGGNALMSLFEAVRGRPLSKEVVSRFYNAGLVVWLAFAVLIIGRFAYEAYRYASGG